LSTLVAVGDGATHTGSPGRIGVVIGSTFRADAGVAAYVAVGDIAQVADTVEGRVGGCALLTVVVKVTVGALGYRTKSATSSSVVNGVICDAALTEVVGGTTVTVTDVAL
jgi:hypothetical protein